MKVYTQPSCGMCTVLKIKLREKGYEFEEINDLDVLIEEGFTSIPVLELEDGETLQGLEALKWVQEQQ